MWPLLESSLQDCVQEGLVSRAVQEHSHLLELNRTEPESWEP